MYLVLDMLVGFAFGWFLADVHKAVSFRTAAILYGLYIAHGMAAAAYLSHA